MHYCLDLIIDQFNHSSIYYQKGSSFSNVNIYSVSRVFCDSEVYIFEANELLASHLGLSENWATISDILLTQLLIEATNKIHLCRPFVPQPSAQSQLSSYSQLGKQRSQCILISILDWGTALWIRNT